MSLDLVRELRQWDAALSDGPTSKEDEVRGRLAEMDDPEKFAREVLGALPLTRQQQRFLRELVEIGFGRWVLKGGHATGKTGVTAFAVLFGWGPLACQITPAGLPLGCKVLLSAPKASAIRGTIYEQLIRFAAVAARNGLPLPGWKTRNAEGYRGASSSSVLWHADRKLWEMETATAAPRADGGIATGVSGRHHAGQQFVILEEAEGSHEGIQIAVDGLAAAENVYVFAPLNPTSAFSPIASRVIGSPETWRQIEFPVWDHPNVRLRKAAHPGSASHRKLETVLRSAAFERRRLAAEVTLEPAKLDFVYALPGLETPDKPGPRPDGIPGHPDAEPQVFRPTGGIAAGQWLGDWLREDESRLLFHVNKIRAVMAAGGWRQPEGPPNRVGLDCAQSRAPVACPAWGPPGRDAHDAKAEPGTIVLGHCIEVRYGAGDEIQQGERAARHLVELYGTEALYVHDIAYGGYVASALAAKGCTVDAVGFGDAPRSGATVELGRMKNQRAEMAAHAALVLNSGIVALPHCSKLLAQMVATGALIPPKDVRAGGSVLREKREIETALGGKSPDELDAVGLSLSCPRPVVFAFPALV